MTRTELIHFLTGNNTDDGDCITKAVRGNTLWVLKKKVSDCFIVCYQLTRNPDKSWSYETEYESKPPTSLSCPLRYLTKTDPVCEDWRQKVREYREKKQGIKDEIRRLYKISRKEKKRLYVRLKAKPGYVIRLHKNILEEAILDIEKITPGVDGRFDGTGLLYSVPLQLVVDIFIKEDKNNE